MKKKKLFHESSKNNQESYSRNDGKLPKKLLQRNYVDNKRGYLRFLPTFKKFWRGNLQQIALKIN